jgi:hypothetical protein
VNAEDIVRRLNELRAGARHFIHHEHPIVSVLAYGLVGHVAVAMTLEVRALARSLECGDAAGIECARSACRKSLRIAEEFSEALLDAVVWAGRRPVTIDVEEGH